MLASIAHIAAYRAGITSTNGATTVDDYDRWYRSYQRKRRLAVLAGYGLELVALTLIGFAAGLVFAKAWLG